MFFAAQRYGLVEAPPQLLTEDEWKKVKEKANLRQDFQQPCVICKEELGLHQHVSVCLFQMSSFCNAVMLGIRPEVKFFVREHVCVCLMHWPLQGWLIQQGYLSVWSGPAC